MSVAVEYLRKVQEAYQVSRKELGYVHPPIVSDVLTNDLELGQKIIREIYRHPTRPFFYDGAKEMITALLGEGDDFCIWSEDYFIRLGTAGFGDIRRGLPSSERKRLFIRSAADKHALIPGLLTYAQEHNLQRAIFVDNEEKSLHQAKQIADDHSASVETSFVLAALNGSPPSRISPNLPGATITSIRDLLLFRANHGDTNHNSLWVADFNYTLLDTHAFEHNQMGSVATLLYKANTV